MQVSTRSRLSPGITPFPRRRGTWHSHCQPQMWQLQTPKEEPLPPAPGWAHPAWPRCSSSLPAAPAWWCGGVRIWPGADNPLAELAWGMRGRLCCPGTPVGRLARDFANRELHQSSPRGSTAAWSPPHLLAHSHGGLCGDPPQAPIPKPPSLQPRCSHVGIATWERGSGAAQGRLAALVGGCLRSFGACRCRGTRKSRSQLLSPCGYSTAKIPVLRLGSAPAPFPAREQGQQPWVTLRDLAA